jgi:UDP-glucose 4-epimerase
MKVLIPGIAGGIARQVATRLLAAGHEVAGIDVRPWPDAPKAIAVHTLDLRKRAAEDVFRKQRPDAVIHMATVTALTVTGEERQRINLGGTRAVFDHCRNYGVRQVLFIGRHTFYGASPDAPLRHLEDEPPQQSLDSFPELGDLVAADLYAATALWRFPEITTAVLRPCYTLGISRTGTLAAFLGYARVPLVFGFDPLFQFMHEEDIVTAIVLALEKKIRGVFNVAGPQPLPFSWIIRGSGATPVPLPEFLVTRLLGRFGFPKLSSGAIEHIKYPVVIDASAFRAATGFQHVHDEDETLSAFRRLLGR